MDNISDKTNNIIEPLPEKFVVRFPQGMRSQIHQVANRARRSMNKEIVARLEHSLANLVTVPGNGSAFYQNTLIENALLRNNKHTSVSEIDSMSDDNKAYTEVILTNKLRQKIALLSYERKCALLKLL